MPHTGARRTGKYDNIRLFAYGGMSLKYEELEVRKTNAAFGDFMSAFVRAQPRVGG